MKWSTHNFFFIGGISLLLGFTSCRLETATPPSKKELIVVSDFLNPSDSVLFTDFEREHGVDVQLHIMSMDLIVSTLKSKGLNAGIDLILPKNLYDLNRLHKAKVVHPIQTNQFNNPPSSKFSSNSYHFIGYGIDPYVFIQNQKMRYRYRTYNELTNHPFISTLTPKETTQLLAPIYKKLSTVEANQWILRFYQRKTDMYLPTDSLNDSIPILSLQSTYFQTPLLKSNYASLVYPNQRSSGSFYNVRSFVVVDQAENYTTAVLCIDYFLEEKQNEKFNRSMGTTSIYQYTDEIRLYNEKPELLIPYYELVDRTKKRIQK